MTNKELRYFRHAKNIAMMSDFKRCQVGSVVVCGNKILSVGFSSNRTHPLQQIYNQYRGLGGNSILHKLHSETSALIRIKDLDVNWSKVSLYIYRIYKGKDREFGLARPCEACLHLIKDLGIKNIYYTTYDGFCKENIF